MSASHSTKFVEWSDEDNCFIGRCPDLFFGGVHGPNEMKVYRELCLVVNEWERIRGECRESRRRFTPRAGTRSRGPKRGRRS